MKPRGKIPRRRRSADGAAAETEADTVFDLKRREIYITGDINETSVHHTVRALRAIDSAKEAPITVMLSSQGGNDYDGWAIYDALRMARNHVTIEGYGRVMSIAALILQAADERLLAPWCRFMIHNGSDSMDATVDQFIDNARELKVLTRAYHRALYEKARPKISMRRIAEMCKRDTYLSAQQAVDMGFADGIITERQ